LSFIFVIKKEKKMNRVLLETPKGIAELEKLYVSELGFLMLKIYFQNGTYTTYNLGKHNPNDNLFTKELFKDELVGSPRD
jgi:hypothetical protein